MGSYEKNGEIITHENLTPEELREFMNLHGVSVNELADIFGVSIQAVNLWLTGQRSVSVTNSRLINLFIKYPRLIREF